jgi:Fe2+ or Zn2+ uptake regulation protein
MQTEAREHLTDHGVRPSVQRLAVMEYLMAHKTHPTAEDIFAALSPEMPTLSRTTVYNTLSMLAGCGAIAALDLEAGRTHWDGDTEPHAHFLCTRCGNIEDIHADRRNWRMMEAAMEPPEGAKVTQTQLLYKGLCAACNPDKEQWKSRYHKLTIR